MKLLLDTQILIWADEQPQRIPGHLRAVLQPGLNQWVLSIASVWELQIKTQIGKLHLQNPLPLLLASQQQTNRLQLLPIQLPNVLALENLPFHHKDPFDRLLIAQAIAENLTLVSVDPVFSAYSVNLLN
ncbi:MAG: type II toxin-antitoxin system VapC family toxin [Acidobacteria bacterium]|nr:type II toxin-antitoxin system VapC family toxin [Acidobacteriota bacterium]MBI3422969.1 type II toxin-antitoxin system VapC family toxin [Acidobacteriota bacterium]